MMMTVIMMMIMTMTMTAMCNVSFYHEGSSCHGVLVSKPEPVSFEVEKGSDKHDFFFSSKLKKETFSNI